MKKVNRIIAALLSASIMIHQAPFLDVNAATNYVLNDNEKGAIESRCRILQSRTMELSSGEYGLLYQLNTLAEYLMYVKFIGDSGAFTSGEVTVYQEDLASKISDFNKRYSESSSTYSYEPVTLTEINLTDQTSFRSSITSNLSDMILNYVSKMYLAINKEYTEASTEALRSSVLSGHSSELRMLYSIIETYEDTILDLTNLSSGTDLVVNIDYEYSIDGTEHNSVVKPLLEEIKSTYSELYKAGQTLSNAHTSSSTGITVDRSKTAIENFTDAVYNNGELQVPVTPSLSGAYLAILACSTVYDPFRSYVGSEEFLSALSYLSSNETQGSELVTLYNENKNYRKPLYFRELDEEGAPVGTAEILTLETFLDKIETGSSIALVTIQGSFELDTDSQTWIYSSEKSVVGSDSDTADASSKTEEETETENSTDKSASLIQTIVPARTVSINSLLSNMISAADSTLSTGWDVMIKYAKQEDNSLTEKDFYGSPENTNRIIKTVAQAKNERKVWADKLDMNQLRFAIGEVDTSLEGLRNAFNTYYNSVYNASVPGNSSSIVAVKLNDDASAFLNSLEKYASENNVNLKSLYGNKKKIKTNLFDLLYKAENENQDWMSNVDVNELYKHFANTLYKGNSFSYAALQRSVNEYFSDKKTAESVETEQSTNDAAGSESDGQSSSDASNADASQYTDLDAKSIIYADSQITDVSKMSDPIMYLGTVKNRSVDNMTTAILTNICQNSANIKSVNNKDIRFVYMNAFGDIVLDDNLVILPGIVNPIMWKQGSSYNPYSTTVMNNYPGILYKATQYTLYRKQDINKYIIFGESKENAPIGGSAKASNCYLYKSKSTKGFSKTQLSCMDIDTEFEMQDGSDETQELLKLRTFLYSTATSITDDVYPFCTVNSTTINNSFLFPYYSTFDSGFSNAKLIAGNCYHKLMINSSSSEEYNQGKLNDNYILHNIIISGLDGTNNPLAYTKNSLLQYDQFVENTMSRTENFIYNAVSAIISTVDSVVNVIGVKSIYCLDGFGKALTFLRSNIVVAIAIIVAAVLISFLKNRRTLFESVVVATFTSILMYALIVIVPLYLQYAFNAVTNNLAENLAYEIVAAKSEQESILYNTTAKIDSAGFNANNSASITLYKYPFYKINEMCKNLNISIEDVTGSNTMMINEDAGIFVENDSIKMSLDALMNTLKIEGEYDSAIDNGVYALKSYKTVSSNLDYYTPYYQIIDNFLDKINTLIGIYNIPRKTNLYSNNIQKDAYGVSSYITSLPFISPGVYLEDIDEEYERSLGLSEEILATYISANQEMAKRLQDAFGSNDDWLGISDVLLDLDTATKSTLWADTLQRNGYYNSDWTVNEEAMSELIHYVNYVVKKFIYDNEDFMSELSDDTLVKIISLRALTALNQKAMSMSNQLYPLFINYDDITLGNILLSIFTDNYTEFISYDMDTVEYIQAKYGWPTTALLCIAVLGMIIITISIVLLFPLLYFLFCILLLFRVLSYRNIHSIIKGYLKLVAIVFVIYNLFCGSILVTKLLNGSFLCVLFLLISTVILIWMLYTLFSCLFLDLSNLGNNAINAKIAGNPFARSISNVFSSFQIRNAVLNRNSSTPNFDYELNSGLSEYSNENDIDTIYNDFGNSFTQPIYFNDLTANDDNTEVDK